MVVEDGGCPHGWPAIINGCLLSAQIASEAWVSSAQFSPAQFVG